MYKMGDLINGKEIATNVKEEIAEFVAKRRTEGKKIPQIASIVVGNDGGSLFYINSQEKIANNLGIKFEKVLLEESIEEHELIEYITKLNLSKDIDGIILQLPLPKKFNEKVVISAISPEKDIDCLTYENQGKLYMGEQTFLPCTPNSVINMLKSLNIDICGKEVVVIGRSNIVGKPLANLLLKENATVTICHSKTENLKGVCKRADILISAIGKPKYITSEYIKNNAIVIDVGTSSFEGKITGDVDFESAKEVAKLISPVPGGVGALTTTLLIRNVCEAVVKNEN